MPAKDRHHDTVVRALIKDGWTIVAEQVFIKIARRMLWIDIRATKSTEVSTVLIEVKDFEGIPSPVEYLASTMGKYELYRAILDELGDDSPLYLAVPTTAFNGILSELIGQVAIRKANIHLIVFEPSREEIIQWIL